MVTHIGGTSRYSDFVIHDNIAYFSGIVPTKDGSVYEQTKEVLELIDMNLKLAGSSKNCILEMTIYLKDETTYEEMNLAFDEWIINTKGPARATIGNIKLPNPMWKIEIVIRAFIPKTHLAPNYKDLNYVR